MHVCVRACARACVCGWARGRHASDPRQAFEAADRIRQSPNESHNTARDVYDVVTVETGVETEAAQIPRAYRDRRDGRSRWRTRAAGAQRCTRWRDRAQQQRGGRAQRRIRKNRVMDDLVGWVGSSGQVAAPQIGRIVLGATPPLRRYDRRSPTRHLVEDPKGVGRALVAE